MPFKTQYGSHYHETYGCHGATIPCDATGLTPCSDCCGSGDHGSAGPSGGSPSGGGTGSHIVQGETECERQDGTPSDMTGESNSVIARSTETAAIGTQAMAEGMALSDVPSVSAIARHLIEEQDDGQVEHQDGRRDALAPSWSRDDAYEKANLTDQARQQLRQGVGYRSELLFGEGHTEAPSVLTHETFTMGNTDIIDTLSATILAGTDVGRKLEHISAVMSGTAEDAELEDFLDRAAHDECDPEGVALFQDEVLPAIREVTGYDVNHVMWLCESADGVVDSYGDLGDITEDDVDEHPIGGVILSDIGTDGVLWGYTDSIEKPNDGWGWW